MASRRSPIGSSPTETTRWRSVNLGAVIAAQDSVILGRRSYEEWAEFWPGSDIEPFATFMNGVAKYVATSTPLEPKWANTTVVDGELVEFVRQLIRWMQEVRRFTPSTVSRRISIVAGFFRTCVIDEVLATWPAEHVRRPNVPPESPTLGLTHLQFEAMLTAARESANPNDFALVALLGLLGLRIFEATGADITDLGEEHGHRVLKVRGKGDRVVLVPLPPAVGRALDRAVAGRTEGSCYATSEGCGWTATPPLFVSDTSPTSAACGSPGCTPTCSSTLSSPPCSTPASTCATCRSPPATPTRAPRCVTNAPATTSTDTPTTSSPLHGVRYLTEDPARADERVRHSGSPLLSRS
jgi:hypothetical protein